MVKGSTWPTAGHDAQWFSTLPDNLHPHLWRSSPMGSTLDECAGRGWVTYACYKEGNVAQGVQPPSNKDRTAWLDLQYSFGKHSKVGERLVASGHIVCPREYALSLDPFAGFGRIVKEVALGRYGEDYDDAACYPSITAAIVPIGSRMANLFTARYGRFLQSP